MKCIGLISGVVAIFVLGSCLGPRSASGMAGGEVTGVGGPSYNEPTPYGMVFVKKGSLKVGMKKLRSIISQCTPN